MNLWFGEFISVTKEDRFLFSVCWKTSNHAPRALPRLKFLSISMRMESKMCLPRAEALEEPMPSPSLMTPEGCQKRTSIAWWLRKDCFEKQLRSYGYSVKQAASQCHSQAPWTAAAATAASLQLFRRIHRGRSGLSRSSINDNDLHLKQWTYIQRLLQREK